MTGCRIQNGARSTAQALLQRSIFQRPCTKCWTMLCFKKKKKKFHSVAFLKKMMEGRVETKGSSQRCCNCLDYLAWMWNAPDLLNWAHILTSCSAIHTVIWQIWTKHRPPPTPPPPPITLHEPFLEKPVSSVKGIIIAMKGMHPCHESISLCLLDSTYSA